MRNDFGRNLLADPGTSRDPAELTWLGGTVAAWGLGGWLGIFKNLGSNQLKKVSERRKTAK